MSYFVRITIGSLVILVLCFNGLIRASYVPSPTDLQIASGANGLSVILSWSFVHPDSADGFIIYKSGIQIDSISTDTTVYTDNSEMLGYFYVTAYRGTEESNPSNTVSDTVIITRDVQIWEWWVPAQPSGFGWDTLTGIGYTYNCTPGNAEYIDFYLNNLRSLGIVSADEPPYEGFHTTGILFMGFVDFNIVPPTGYYNWENALINAYYAVVTRLETANNHFAKIRITSVSIEYPEYIIFDTNYQLIQGLRLLSSMTAVEEEKPNNIPHKGSFIVSPNPFTGSITISLPGIREDESTSLQGKALRIYDVSGRLVESFSLTTNHLSLNTDFEPGIYFLKVKGYKSEKIVKLQ